MKIRFLLAYLVLSASVVLAVPTFTSDDFIRIGDIIKTYSATATAAIPPGAAGANQTWDFSGLPAPSAPTNTVYYISPSGTPYASQFPSATLTEKVESEGNTVYSYSEKTNAMAAYVGFGSPDLSYVHSDSEKYVIFPFTYNTSFTDSFAATLTVPGATVNRTGNIQFLADGHGTLKLPNGVTYTDVLRTKHIQTIRDVISSSGFTITTDTVTTSYAWLAQGFRYSLFSVVQADITVTTGVGKDAVAKKETAHAYSFTNIAQSSAGSISGGGGGGSEIESRWIPHVTRSGGGFLTNIQLFNQGSGSQTVTLNPYTSAGAALTPRSVTLNANAVQITSSSTLFGGEDVGQIGITGSNDVVVSAAYRTSSGDGATGHIHETKDSGTSFWLYQGERDVVFDGLAAVNLGTTTATITATLYGENHEMLGAATLTSSLASRGKYITVFDGVLPDTTNGIIHIQSSQPIVVTFLRGTRVGVSPAYLYANNPVDRESGAVNRWISHVTRSGAGFQTTIYLFNTKSSSETVTLQPYSSAGVALTARTVTLAANQLRISSSSELFAGEDVGQIKVTGSSDVVVSAAYRTATGEGASGHLHESGEGKSEYWLYQGERSVVFDGLAAVNLGSSNAMITATLYDTQNTVIGTATLTNTLAPNGKYITVFDGVLPDTTNGIIRIQSSQPIEITFLRGTRVGTSPAYLYANNPVDNE